MLNDEEEVRLPELRPPLANTSEPRDKEPPMDELEMLLKWQEDRLQRRLRGEYESQMRRLTELVNNNLTLSTQIRAVHILGADRTRASFLRSIISPIFTPPSPTKNDDLTTTSAATFESALHQTRLISDVLNRSGIFRSIEPKLERSKEPLAGTNDVDLVITCKEQGRYYLKTATEIGNNEGSASMMVRLRNVFGGAENFEATFSLGSRTKHAFNAAFTAPLTPDLRTSGALSAYSTEQDFSTFASCREAIKGARAAIKTSSSLGSHEIAYEAVLRHIGDLSPNASVSIREAAGFSTKSAISHLFVRNSRDSLARHTHGWYIKLFQELAGFGGDASHIKSEADVQVAKDLTDGQTFSISARAGLVHPLGPLRKTLWSDRFQLGGPFSLRSFRHNSMGPRDGGDSLGGEIYWALGASLIGDIPYKPHWPLKTHFFVNAGRLESPNQSAPIIQSLHGCLSQPSVSAGIGLLYQFNPIRVELNFAMPLIAARSDGLQRGFQAGIGIEFL